MTMNNLRSNGNTSDNNDEYFKKIFENLPSPILITDKDGNVLLANSATAMVMDISLSTLLKSNLKDLVGKRYYDRSFALEAASKEEVVTGIITTRRNVSLKSTCTPIRDPNGNVQVVITISSPMKLKSDFQDTLMFGDQRKREIEYLRSYVLNSDEIIAESALMREVMLKCHSVASTSSTVVLHGESGTGKEVMAKYIHQHSKRANEAFIVVNCASIPEHLVESELFGYVKGAFTGASVQGKIGLFEAADHGTLLLDEIAELPLSFQAKLLRVLESNEVRRVGSNVNRKVDFRLIAATHKNLKKMTEEGLFREDLYYRLDVFPIEIPPLRERQEDIVAISKKMLDCFNEKYNCDVELSRETLNLYKNYHWPGNVRELRNHVERKVINSMSNIRTDYMDIASSVSKKMLGQQDMFATFGLNGTLNEVKKKVEKMYINYVIESCEGRMGKAAEKLGIDRTFLYRKLKSFD